MKRICGIELKGKEARIAVIEIANDNSIQIYNSDFKKIGIKDHKNQTEIKSFETTIKSFFKDHDISQVVIKGRQPTGPAASGGITFKMEGIIQTAPIPVEIIYPITINKSFKANDFLLDVAILNKYQLESYKTAQCKIKKMIG